MTPRNLLPAHLLEEFRNWALHRTARDYREMPPTRHPYEVLRIQLHTPSGTNPDLVYYRRKNSDRVTADSEEAAALVVEWLQDWARTATELLAAIAEPSAPAVTGLPAPNARVTPGPWIVAGPFNDIWPASDVGKDKDGKWVELVPEPRILGSMREPADAMLAAAAPKLYAALDRLLREYTAVLGSGDCGFFGNVEDLDEIKAARDALLATGPEPY